MKRRRQTKNDFLRSAFRPRSSQPCRSALKRAFDLLWLKKKNKRLLAVYLNTMQSIHKSHAIWQILSCRILHLAWRDVTWPTLYTLHCLLSQTSYNVTQCLTCIMASPTLSIRKNKLKYSVVKNWQPLLYMLLSFFIRSSTLSSSSADIWPSLLISWEIW